MTNMTRSIVSAAALLAALGGCSVPPSGDASRAAQNANTPGWTGSTFVIGSTSTVAGNAQATYEQQKWGVGRQR
jgi:ABC-type phosphate transport system substrate-binding protein